MDPVDTSNFSVKLGIRRGIALLVPQHFRHRASASEEKEILNRALFSTFRKTFATDFNSKLHQQSSATIRRCYLSTHQVGVVLLIG